MAVETAADVAAGIGKGFEDTESNRAAGIRSVPGGFEANHPGAVQAFGERSSFAGVIEALDFDSHGELPRSEVSA